MFSKLSVLKREKIETGILSGKGFNKGKEVAKANKRFSITKS